MDIEKTIREYLPNILHMSLGTCVDNKPWVCEVHFVYDDDLNLYWRSMPSRRHSQDIDRNPQVAGNIVVQHGPGEKPRGLYFEGMAQALTDIDESSPVYQLFADRLGVGPDIIEKAREEDGPHFYKVTVADWYMFDARESSPPQKYHFANNRG
jgi:uncharacterized protein YhbP (UPF0306 family)